MTEGTVSTTLHLEEENIRFTECFLAVVRSVTTGNLQGGNVIRRNAATRSISRKLRRVSLIKETQRRRRSSMEHWIMGLRKSSLKSHETLFEIARRSTTITVHDLLTDYHMFLVDDVITSYEERKTWAFRQTLLHTDDMFEDLEMDDMDLSRLVVEYLLTDEMREKIRIRFDHHANFIDYSGGLLFVMALDICNASVSFDIEGAQEKFEALALDDFPGDNLT
jgi:hypothetical protein